MPQKTFDITKEVTRDSLAQAISEKWLNWLNARATWEERYKRVLQYLYSTSTDTIYGQASNPWSANVHIPKLTQLRDTLITYEIESIFSLQDFFSFEGFTRDANTILNRRLITNLMKDILDKGNFRGVIEKLVCDYIDAGNAYSMPLWDSKTVKDSAGITKIFWEGVKAHRINPLDIVFDPTATSFEETPKIIRTVLSVGQVAALAEKDPVMKEAFNKAMKIRQDVMTAVTNGDMIQGDMVSIAGFGNWSTYYNSDIVELLTFYGTIYDTETKKLKKDCKLTIMDRSVVLQEEPLEDVNGGNYIFKTGYRDRKDVLWSMSPLENLLGMQARIDFLENKRSDCYDATVNPIKKIRGNVDLPDALGPGDELRMDTDADVTYLTPDTSILTADTLIDRYEAKMEEFAGSPKEVLGFRTPGEKTMFEVNQLMTAATRIFQRQIRKFEVELLEPLLNSILQLYLKKKAGQKVTLKYWDTQKEYYSFKDISIDAINGLGKIVVAGSRVAQDKEKIAQALQMLGQNPLFLDEAVRNNFSPATLGQIFAYVSGLDRFTDLIKKDSRLFEITEQQKLVERLSQQVDRERAEGLAELDQEDNTAVIQKELALARNQIQEETPNEQA